MTVIVHILFFFYVHLAQQWFGDFVESSTLALPEAIEDLSYIFCDLLSESLMYSWNNVGGKLEVPLQTFAD